MLQQMLRAIVHYDSCVFSSRDPNYVRILLGLWAGVFSQKVCTLKSSNIETSDVSRLCNASLSIKVRSQVGVLFQTQKQH